MVIAASRIDIRNGSGWPSGWKARFTAHRNSIDTKFAVQKKQIILHNLKEQKIIAG
jgi:hypothetical protein